MHAGFSQHTMLLVTLLTQQAIILPCLRSGWCAALCSQGLRQLESKPQHQKHHQPCLLTFSTRVVNRTSLLLILLTRSRLCAVTRLVRESKAGYAAASRSLVSLFRYDAICIRKAQHVVLLAPTRKLRLSWETRKEKLSPAADNKCCLCFYKRHKQARKR